MLMKKGEEVMTIGWEGDGEEEVGGIVRGWDDDGE